MPHTVEGDIFITSVMINLFALNRLDVMYLQKQFKFIFMKYFLPKRKVKINI